MVLAAHRTALGRGMVATTVETVRFERPVAVHFRLVRGPIPHVVERFELTEDGDGTLFHYEGELGAHLWVVGRWWGDRRRRTRRTARATTVGERRDSMSVMVQYIVKVSDVDRFVTTSEKFAPMMEEMGGRNGGVYEDENDPSLVSTISEWESHDEMHEAIEKYDDQFNEEAGTADLRWTTHIWHRRGSA
jgi:hypothetical protein